MVAVVSVLLSGHAHSCQDSAQLVLFRHLTLVRPPQSLHVWLYICRYCRLPLSAGQHKNGIQQSSMVMVALNTLVRGTDGVVWENSSGCCEHFLHA